MSGEPAGNPIGIKQSAFLEERQGAKYSELTKGQSVYVRERRGFEDTAESVLGPTQAGSMAGSWTELSLKVNRLIYYIFYKTLRFRVIMMRPP